MRACAGNRGRAALFALLASLSGCSGVSPPQPPGQIGVTPPPAPSPPVKSGPGGAVALVPVPKDVTRSGTLLRVELKSDQTEFLFGPPGQRWIVVSAGRAEPLRGPLRFRPEAAPARAAALIVTAEDGGSRRLLSPADIYPAEQEARVLCDGKPYRGSLRVWINPRGLLTVINRVDLEEYLYGVVPAEMGPKRYDELEALKAQAVAARTYALARRGQFENEGYDLCSTAKCQVYSGLSAEDPLSSAAVDATRGLVLAHEGHFADALFVSTCGGRTENVENVFGEPAVPYLVSVECAELATSTLPGAALGKSGAAPRTGLQWRGYVLARHVPARRAGRAARLETALQWAGLERKAFPPASLKPAAVYPSLIAAFGLEPAQSLHLLARERSYYGESPPVSGRLSGASRDAYDLLVRMRFGAGESLPAPDRTLSEEEYAGLLFSAVLRQAGVMEGQGRFLRREASNVWVKTPEGRQGLPVDPELPLARRAGDVFLPAAALTLRAGDRVRWWKRGSRVLALWVEFEVAAPSFERESSWTEWVRRVSGRELARRMAARVAGNEVREVAVTRRSASGRAIEIRVRTDAGELVLRRFDLRQALELPEMLFTVQKARGAQGEPEFIFLGRGWGHGVGLCQNGAYGMALAGASYDQILRHYYTNIDIVAADALTPAPPSSRETRVGRRPGRQRVREATSGPPRAFAYRLPPAACRALQCPR